MAIFVVHRHRARKLHWDLRLEMGGVLRSWAVPKEPPLVRGVRRLAIQVEDHPLEYADFEGVIPEGSYGAGVVEIWDRGDFRVLGEEEDKLVFFLRGEKMRGRYVLLKFSKAGENAWLLFKT